MRLTLAAAALLLCSSMTMALAQTPLTGTTGPANSAPPATTTPPSSAATTPPTAADARPARPRRHRMSLAERFAAANTTHDGHLTQEQARSKMPSIARDFAAIDTGNKGYVTLDDIRAHNHARRVARRAARAATAPTSAPTDK